MKFNIMLGVLLIFAGMNALAQSSWRGEASVWSDGLPASGFFAATDEFPPQTVLLVRSLKTNRSLQVRVIARAPENKQGNFLFLNTLAGTYLGLGQDESHSVLVTWESDISISEENIISSRDPQELENDPVPPVNQETIPIFLDDYNPDEEPIEEEPIEEEPIEEEPIEEEPIEEEPIEEEPVEEEPVEEEPVGPRMGPRPLRAENAPMVVADPPVPAPPKQPLAPIRDLDPELLPPFTQGEERDIPELPIPEGDPLAALDQWLENSKDLDRFPDLPVEEEPMDEPVDTDPIEPIEETPRFRDNPLVQETEPQDPLLPLPLDQPERPKYYPTPVVSEKQIPEPPMLSMEELVPPSALVFTSGSMEGAQEAPIPSLVLPTMAQRPQVSPSGPEDQVVVVQPSDDIRLPEMREKPEEKDSDPVEDPVVVRPIDPVLPVDRDGPDHVSTPGKLRGDILGRVKFISSLDSSQDYIQLGVYQKEDSLALALDRLESYVPLSLLIQSNGAYQLLAGPMPRDQVGVLIYHYRTQGFRDAFVIRGR